jgi:hypothetical protein
MFNPKIIGPDRAETFFADESLWVVTAQPCRVFKVTCFNMDAVAHSFQLFDLSSEPGVAYPANASVVVPPDSFGSIEFAGGRVMQDGIFIGLTTVGSGWDGFTSALPAIFDASYSLR